MKRILTFLSILILSCLWCLPATGIELVRQKNVATILYFPIVDGAGDLVNAAADLDSETDTWNDGAAADGFADLAAESAEINSGGWYSLALAQSEMNFDYIAIQIKSSTTGSIDQRILIRTQVGDPLNIATSDDGGTINVTGGAVDTVTTTTTATTATTCGTVNALAANVITAASINANAITDAKVANDVQVDIISISTSSEAADRLEASAETIVTAAAATGTLSTTQMTTNLTEITNDHYNGRIIIWTSGVLKDQATDITDYDGATKKLTYTGVTEAPSDGDTFNIL